jgi:serine/threonine-protein kinase
VNPGGGGGVADELRERVVAAIGDQYEVEREVGRGSMAVVYQARDLRLGRRVALKVLPPDLAFRAGVRTRFLREAETAAALSHPNVVPIYAVDERAGISFFAMALVDGESLGARLAREPRPPVAVVRRILADVADALASPRSAPCSAPRPT